MAKLNLTRTLAELAALAGGEVSGDGGRTLTGVGSLEGATSDQISHLSRPTYRHLLATTQAGAVILSTDDLTHWQGDALVASNPYLAFARISQQFAGLPDLPVGVDKSAYVASSARISAEAAIGPGACVGERVEVGPGARIYSGTVVGDDCVLGAEVVLMANVVLYSDTRIGRRSVVHSGAVLGADGFGFTPDERGQWVAIAQTGGVSIGEDVSIGACTTIDRGALDDTIIGDGVKIDNQCQIGHNTKIGEHTLICGCVGIVGSTTIGRHVVLAGGAGVGGDGPVDICDHVIISATTLVTQSISEPGKYSGGVLHSESGVWKRNALRFRDLDRLFRRVSRLEKHKDG